jgi:type II secretory pathway pseudopilin PulG
MRIRKDEKVGRCVYDLRRHPRPRRSALTLLEMAIALAIMAVVMAALLPQFRNIENSWASKQGRAETLQNARVLIDHINRNLCRAERITAVSAHDVVNGFIEYEDAEGLTNRYEIGANQSVHFGPPGNLSELAGPVGRLQFVCHDARDLDTPITDVDLIRAVRVRTVLINAADTGQDKPFETMAYLRSNGPIGITTGTTSRFGITTGNTPALANIDATHCLCAFTGPGDDGWAVVLTVDTAAQTVSNEAPFEYDTETGVNPSLAQIDATRYLCVYKGPQGDGLAVILRVDPVTWAIGRGIPLEFDDKDCFFSSLSRIDATRFLCAYTGGGSDGYAVILEVNPVTMTVAMGAPFEFDTDRGQAPALKRLDSDHFLCVYQGWSGWIWAVVLTADTDALTVSKETPCALGLGYGDTPALAEIDENHFMCVYSGNASDGMAVVLHVNHNVWQITRGRPFQYDVPLGKVPAVIQLADNTRYLCAYQGDLSRLWATVLVVNPLTWDIHNEDTTALSSWKALKPDLAKIDDYNYLCVHEDQVNTGWGLLLNVGGVRP